MLGKQTRWLIMLPVLMLLLANLACGGFQVRVTPAAKPSPTATLQPTVQPRISPTAIPATAAPTRTPTVAPSPTAAPAGLVTGKGARITASGGVNVRDKASTAGAQIGKLLAGVIVTVRAGPTDLDGYTWWQVDDGAGEVGWVAAGTKDDPWLTPDQGSGPAAGGGKLVESPDALGRSGASHDAGWQGAHHSRFRRDGWNSRSPLLAGHAVHRARRPGRGKMATAGGSWKATKSRVGLPRERKGIAG